MTGVLENLFETGYTIITDKEGTILEVSNSLEDLTGYSSDFLVGKHTRIFNSGYHDKSFFKGLWETILSGKSWNGIIRNRAKGGKIIWVNTTIFPLFDDHGKIEKFLAVRNDVTKEKEIEQKLIESEARLKEAQALTHIGNWELDFTTNKLIWSEEVYRIFNIEPENHQITFEEFINFVPQEERSKVDQAFKESIENKTSYQIVHQIKLENGEIKTLEEKGKTLYDKKGRAIKSIGTIQDVTERVKREQAEQELREKEAMINEINHRTKNNIQIVSSILSLHATKSKNETVKGVIQEAQDRVNTIAKVHETLYTTSEYGEINIKNHLSALIDNLLDIYNKENKTIDYYLIDSNVSHMDIKMIVPISLILNELVTNTMKYAFIHSEKGAINVSITLNDDIYVFEYSDNGVWLNQQSESGFGTTLIRIFFQQLKGTCELNTENGTKYTFTFPKTN